MTTRAVILRRAFGRIGIADYEFDVNPEERADARVMLDGMMAEWAGTGIDLAYTPSDGTDNDGVAMTTPSYADAAIWNNLAVRLAPDYGKMPMPALMKDAKRGYDLVTAKTLVIPVDRRPSRQLIGGGDRYYRRFVY
ncbi:MAG: hypothetical protein EOP89_08195 [Lysobacteraceae bacterium]|nr:MAG: hypothetical protein EOP89_08195 [Xanthomonadaceae bacterium]